MTVEADDQTRINWNGAAANGRERVGIENSLVMGV